MNFTRDEEKEEIIVWDSYRCHYITEETKEAIQEFNLVNVIIPGGCTRVLQTCDVVWNSPLKAHLRTLWNQWMKTGEKSYTKGGNLRTMSKTQLVNNIVSAWNMISEETIVKSFKICGQVLDCNPDEILCMREGNPCEGALGTLKDLLQFPTHQLDISTLSVLPEGIVKEVDMNLNLDMIDEIDEEQDPLDV